MSEEPTQSDHYNLVLDEKRHLILSLFMQVLMVFPMARTIFDQLCVEHGVTQEEIVDFIKDWSDKEHAMGWCKDPDCKVTNGA